MLAYFTFAYFFLLFLYILRKRGLDISACIIGVYMLNALGSIYLLRNDVEYINKAPSLLPTIVYCSMITLVTYPFYKFNSNKVRVLPHANEKYFNIISWTLIVGFLFAVFLFKDDIVMRLAMGDEIGQLRGQGTKDLGNAQAGLSGPLRFVSSIFMTIISMSAVSFILFFYSLSYLHKKWYFNALLFLSTLGCMVASVVGIDRSIFFYWIIDFIFIYVLFRPYLTHRVKRITLIFGSVLLVAAGAYLMVLTFSRFGDDSFDSIANYMGQSYLNFCWFWDNYEAPVANFGFFFPILSHFLGIDWGAPVDAVSFGWFVESKVGYFVNLFYTFMGTVMLYLGQWAVIPYCIGFTLVANKVLNARRNFGIQSFIRVFIFAVIPYCGVILYLYIDYIRALGALFMLYFCSLLAKH